jgi:hypothetical protein
MDQLSYLLTQLGVLTARPIAFVVFLVRVNDDDLLLISLHPERRAACTLRRVCGP